MPDLLSMTGLIALPELKRFQGHKESVVILVLANCSC